MYILIDRKIYRGSMIGQNHPDYRSLSRCFRVNRCIRSWDPNDDIEKRSSTSVIFIVPKVTNRRYICIFYYFSNPIIYNEKTIWT